MRAKCPHCKHENEAAKGELVRCDQCKKVYEHGHADKLSKKPPIQKNKNRHGDARQSIAYAKESKTNQRDSKENNAFGKWWTYVVIGLVFLAIGYFSGREHIKYEIRNAVTNVFAPLVKKNHNPADDMAEATDYQKATSAERNIAKETLALMEVVASEGRSCKFTVQAYGTTEPSKAYDCILKYQKHFAENSELDKGNNLIIKLMKDKITPFSNYEANKYSRLADENTDYLMFFEKWRKVNSEK